MHFEALIVTRGMERSVYIDTMGDASSSSLSFHRELAVYMFKSCSCSCCSCGTLQELKILHK